MANFEFDDSAIDGIINELKHFEIECPECGRDITISVDDIGATITCPHCEISIELESK